MCGCFDNCVAVLVICVLVFTVFLYCFVYVYLLTPWCRVLLEKLTGLQLVKKFPHFTEPEVSLPH